MTYTLYYYIAGILMMLSAGVTLFIGLKQRSEALKIMVLYIACSFTADLTNWTLYFGFTFFTPSVGGTFRLIELLLLLEFYTRILEIEKYALLKRILQIVAVIVFAFIIGLHTSAPIRVTNTVIFSFLSTVYFIKMIIEMKVDNPVKYPLFWINAAFLAYFSGSVFFSLFLESLVKLHEMSAVLSFGYHNTLGMTKNILIAIAFWVSYKIPGWDKGLAPHQ